AHRELGLEVLRQHEDGGRSARLHADALRRLDPAAISRWHPDVDDRDVRALGDHDRHETVRVGRLAGDLEALVGEESRHAFAEEGGVVAQCDPDDAQGSGIEAVTTVPPSGRAAAVNVPPRALTRSWSPRSPEPAGSTPPRPSSSTATLRTPSPSEARIQAVVAAACFAKFPRASDAKKY